MLRSFKEHCSLRGGSSLFKCAVFCGLVFFVKVVRVVGWLLQKLYRKWKRPRFIVQVQQLFASEVEFFFPWRWSLLGFNSSVVALTFCGYCPGFEGIFNVWDSLFS